MRARQCGREFSHETGVVPRTDRAKLCTNCNSFNQFRFSMFSNKSPSAKKQSPRSAAISKFQNDLEEEGARDKYVSDDLIPYVNKQMIGRNRHPTKQLHATSTAGSSIEIMGGYFLVPHLWKKKYGAEEWLNKKMGEKLQMLSDVDDTVPKGDAGDVEGIHVEDDGTWWPTGTIKIKKFKISALATTVTLADTGQDHSAAHFEDLERVAQKAMSLVPKALREEADDPDSSEEAPLKKTRKLQQQDSNASTASSFDWSGGVAGLKTSKAHKEPKAGVKPVKKDKKSQKSTPATVPQPKGTPVSQPKPSAKPTPKSIKATAALNSGAASSASATRYSLC